MLISLYVENFALIEKLSIELKSGFNVLTGETGAGKSIIIEAINLILGERASSDLIKTGAERAFVESVFSIKDNERLRNFLKKSELPQEDTLIISRELSQNKSIARLNNRTVTQSLLRDISTFLFDIHGQHQHQSLLYPEEHIYILDLFGGKELLAMRTKCELEIHTLQKLQNELAELEKSAADREKEKEYLQFQIDEIDAAKLKAGEWQELQKEQNFLKNAEKLHGKLQQTIQAFEPARADLRKAQALLKDMAAIDEKQQKEHKTAEHTF